MTKEYNDLKNKIEEIDNITNILSIIQWDSAVNMKPKSAPFRHKEVAYLGGLAHQFFCDEKVANLINKSLDGIEQLEPIDQTNLKLIAKNHKHATAISLDIQKESSLIFSASELAWRTARKEENFKLMEPHLDKVFDITRKTAKIKADKLGMDDYQVLVDAYSPDFKIEEIDKTFAELKNKLPILLKKIMEKQSSEKFLPLKEKISEETQQNIGFYIMKRMGFDFERGMLNKSTHPFCGGSLNDVRITTRYDENNFLSSLYAVIHETGHALYQLGLPEKTNAQPVGKAYGMSFHESQSLLMELQVCQSKEFTNYLAKILHDEFGFKGEEYSADNLYKINSRVEPSFIRVDADQVTYPLHVIMRYEIEKEIIYNGLKAKDLPDLWNSKMHAYLGIKPNSPSVGCLQDIHWPAGLIGYFPSYTNGAIIASMVMNKIKQDHPSALKSLEKGDFTNINDFANNNLRKFASSLKADDLLSKATGHKEVKAEIFLNYIENSFL